MAMSRRISSLVLNVAGSVLAATLLAQPAFSKEPRFPLLSYDQLDEKQKALADRVPKIVPPPPDQNNIYAGPFNALFRSPELGQRMIDLGIGYINEKTSVPIRLNEFTMLIVAAQWRAPYIWLIHAPKSVKYGLSPDIVESLRQHKRPSNMTEDEAVVYDFVTELTMKKKVSDETFARARKIFNDQQIVDLTVCAGNYLMTAILLAMIEYTVPPGKEDPFK